MKIFKFLFVSTAILSTNAHADFPIYTSSTIVDEDGSSWIAPRRRSDLVATAAQAASAAYNDATVVGLKGSSLSAQAGFKSREELLQQGYEVTSFSATVPGAGNVPAGIVGYKDGEVIIAYHGSESVEDFTQVNLRAKKMTASDIGLTGYVHGGFKTRYLQSRDALRMVLEDTLARHGLKSAKTMVTGHSLGGGLATLAAADLKKHFPALSDVDLVTFSSPRVCDHEAAENMEALLGGERMIRIWRESDPVPMVSPGVQLLLGYFTGFKHVGQSYKLQSKTTGWFSWLPSLTNHSLGSILEDAKRSEDVRIDADHVGVRSKLKNMVTRGVQTVTNVTKSVVNTVKGLFSRAASWFSRS